MKLDLFCGMCGETTYNFHATWSARNAILGPTPGSEQSSSTVFGTSESKSSCNRCAVCLMYLFAEKKRGRMIVGHSHETQSYTHCVFRLQNPTLAIASEMTASSASNTAWTESDPPSAVRSFPTAASVTSSLVCEESIKDTSVAKR